MTLKQIRDCVPDRFFYYLVTNTNGHSSQELMEYGIELNFPEMEDTTEQYLRYFQDQGYYDNYLAYMLANYRIDESTCDEMVLCAIWKSMYIVPWDREDLAMRNVHAYTYTTLRQFARNHIQRTRLPADCVNADESDLTGKSVHLVRAPHLSRLIQREELDLTVEQLLIASGMRDDLYLPAKRRMLQLLATGYSVEDIVEELGLPKTSVQKWIKRFKASGPDSGEGRIQTRTDGTWRWTEHTARVLLSEACVLSLLTPAEILALRVLSEEGSQTMAQRSETLDGIDAKKLFRQIRVKVQSNGGENIHGGTTWSVYRKRVLKFLGTVTPMSSREAEICRELMLCGGNQSAAARKLGIEKNKVTHFLARKGFYGR